MSQHRHAPAADTSATISAAMAEAMAAAGLEPGRSPSPVRPPRADLLFRHRAERLRSLAAGHRLSSWLAFMSQLSDAQHALASIPVEAPAAPGTRWLPDLEGLRDRLRGTLPATAESALAALPWGDTESLNATAARLLTGKARQEDIGGAPFIVAALQIAWTRHAAGLDAGAVAAAGVAGHCPVGGGAPVAGAIHTGTEIGGLRYLHCGLCHTAWHHVRSACVACGEGNRIELRLIEAGDASGGGSGDPARAETCETCNSYLKLFLMEKAPGLDPVADDLASFALDILVGDEGFRRIGGNPFLAQAGEQAD